MNYKRVAAYTYPIGDTTNLEIKSEGCFKVVVRNDSAGGIRVSGLPIEPAEEKAFDGLPPGCVFDKNFELSFDDSISFTPEIYVTCYTYVEDTCKTA
jgi:hypothetical protein